MSVTPTVEVRGRRPRTLESTPGSSAVVAKEELQAAAPQSAAEPLRTVPGVHVVAEDQAGLRLNIGFRGLDPNRSRRVLVLEDGAPVTLNPYGAPELYYAPAIERMERLEVIKGNGAVLYGPQTIGGVINFTTPDPPRRFSLGADLRYGSFNYLLGQLAAGATHGPVGWRVDLIHRRFDGPRHTDLALTDLTTKLQIRVSKAALLRLKFSLYDENSRSTYLGLTQPQYEENPDASFAIHDRFHIRRYALTALHTLLLRPGLMLSTLLYGYQTQRNWRRQDYDRDGAHPVIYERIIPGRTGDAATDEGESIFFRYSNGVRARDYTVGGIEPRVSWRFARGVLRGDLAAGARLHYESAREQYLQGQFPTAITGMVRDDEARSAVAGALFAQGRLTLLQRLQLSPGIRLELVGSERQVLRQQTRDVQSKSSDFTVAPLPALGASYEVIRPLTLYAGVHRGFAPARIQESAGSVDSTQNQALQAEYSWNYELGARFLLCEWLSAELTGFLLDFDPEVIVTGADQFTTASWHAGLEATGRFDIAELLGKTSYSLPLSFSYSWVPLARLRGEPNAGGRIPYAPEHLVSALLRFEHRVGLSAQLGVSHTAEQFSDVYNTIDPSADGLRGVLPSYTLLDGRVAFRVARIGMSFYVGAKNMTGTRYIASRSPAGIQPGVAQTIYGGASFER